jgi:hypothetical protein
VLFRPIGEARADCLCPDLVPLRPEMLNAAFQHVANRHELVLAEADARRRSGRQRWSELHS